MDLNAFVCDLRQPASSTLTLSIVNLDTDVDGAECDETELGARMKSFIEEAERAGVPHCLVSTKRVVADGCDLGTSQWLEDGVYAVLAVHFAASASSAPAGIEHLPKPGELEGRPEAIRLAQMAKAAGGLLTVQSPGGRNVAWRIYFRAAENSAGVELEEPVSSETVLLVEDEEFVRSVTREVLELSGYRVLEARDASEGLELFTRNKDEVDLVLTDVVMPGMNGTELIRRVHALAPSQLVVYMSG
jgi:hypothetical protein